ncbi:unnamed protein product [Closterium sp. Naga37s-1]|nr:unnamed protein product [Closterium sp. Naga37s-1]
MALPLGKLGDLVLKTLSKPLAKAIKRRAASHPKFRASIANWAQVRARAGAPRAGAPPAGGTHRVRAQPPRIESAVPHIGWFRAHCYPKFHAIPFHRPLAQLRAQWVHAHWCTHIGARTLGARKGATRIARASHSRSQHRLLLPSFPPIATPPAIPSPFSPPPHSPSSPHSPSLPPHQCPPGLPPVHGAAAAAAGYHRFTVRLQRRLYGQAPLGHIKRLNEEKAVSTASEVVGELIVFAVAGGVVFIEAARSARSNARKEAKLKQEREALHERDRQLEEEARRLREREEQPGTTVALFFMPLTLSLALSRSFTWQALHERDRQLEEEARWLRERVEQLEEALAADVWLPRVLTGLATGSGRDKRRGSRGQGRGEQGRGRERGVWGGGGTGRGIGSREQQQGGQ